MKALIEEGTKVRKLLGSTGVGAAGTVEIRATSILGSTPILGSSGMYVTARQE